MIFSVDDHTDQLTALESKGFAELAILERQDLEEWAVNEPRVLGEELLVIASEYSNFDETRDRLDILALDQNGKLVVVELKRDHADTTTDLQAIKYASYCATLTAEDIQRDYRNYWSDDDERLTPEAVGEAFATFLTTDTTEILTTDDGWADFELDDQPRILLAAGDFGIEVTAPVMWLTEEYDLDITCVRLQPYEHDGHIFLDSQQVIPVSEAEEYMTRRREKADKQSEGGQRRRAITVLLNRGVLETGDIVEFDAEAKPSEADWVIDPSDEFWRAEVTGENGMSDNIRWLHDGDTYSFSGLTGTLFEELTGDRPGSINGNKYWRHPAFDDRTISELRNHEVSASERATQSI